MVEHVVDDKGNGTFKTRCDMCKDYTGENNYILSVRLDGAITTDQDIRAVLCKHCALNLFKYISAEASKKTQTRTPKHRDKVADEMEVNKDEM